MPSVTYHEPDAGLVTTENATFRGLAVVAD